MSAETKRVVSMMVARDIESVSDLTPIEVEALLNAAYGASGE